MPELNNGELTEELKELSKAVAEDGRLTAFPIAINDLMAVIYLVYDGMELHINEDEFPLDHYIDIVSDLISEIKKYHPEFVSQVFKQTTRNEAIKSFMDDTQYGNING